MTVELMGKVRVQTCPEEKLWKEVGRLAKSRSVVVQVYSVEQAIADRVEGLEYSLCGSSRPVGLVSALPAHWRKKGEIVAGRRLHIAVKTHGDGEPIRKDLLTHELAHACHVLETEFTVNDLIDAVGNTDREYGKPDLLSHAWVFWKQRQVGVDEGLLRCRLEENRLSCKTDAKGIVKWLGAAMSWVSRDAVIREIKGAGFEQSVEGYLLAIVESAKKAYLGDMAWESAPGELRAMRDSVKGIYSACRR